MDFVKDFDRVLYLWDKEIGPSIEQNVNLLKKRNGVIVNVENVQRLSMASYEASKFNIVFCGEAKLPNSSLELILKLLKPRGFVHFTIEGNPTDLQDKLILTGFLNTKINENEVTGEKPNYEIGSSMKLSFANQIEQKKSKSAAIWKIDGNDDDDNDIIDADDLLDENDKVKPNPESLRVCGTTGKRKACKDCSCGLAEELATDNGTKTEQPIQKSSCGSCYLGDAFRCASCPYLGMPAFKPGEKVQVSENLLKADV